MLSGAVIWCTRLGGMHLFDKFSLGFQSVSHAAFSWAWMKLRF